MRSIVEYFGVTFLGIELHHNTVHVLGVQAIFGWFYCPSLDFPRSVCLIKGPTCPRLPEWTWKKPPLFSQSLHFKCSKWIPVKFFDVTKQLLLRQLTSPTSSLLPGGTRSHRTWYILLMNGSFKRSQKNLSSQSHFKLAAWIQFPWESRTRRCSSSQNTRRLSREMPVLFLLLI